MTLLLRTLAGLLIVAAGARAQTADLGRPLEQGEEDVGPMMTTLRRSLLADLRIPLGFDQVYRRADGLLVRRSGGVTAVFPRSVYTPLDESTLLAEIPPGTVFRIGAGDDAVARPPVGRLGPPASASPAEVAPPVDRALPTVVGDEIYRRRRVSMLIERALAAAAR